MDDSRRRDHASRAGTAGEAGGRGDSTRRGFLRKAGLAAAAAAAAPGVSDLFRLAEAHAQTHEQLRTPFGPDDQRGAVNRITPQKVLEAIRLVKEGKVIDFGRTYEKGMPLFGNRVFSVLIPTTGGPFGDNKTTYHDEIATLQIGQVGTQFDGLGHIGIGDQWYGGRKTSDLIDVFAGSGSDGLKALGIHNCGPVVTRGVLVDVAGSKGVQQLDPKYQVTPTDLEGALQRARVDIRPGDVVVLHTGWGSLWMKDNETFNKQEPGIGVEAAKWLASKQAVVVGADSWAVEIVPNPDAKLAFPCHQELITRNGIYLHENCATERLVQNNVREFLYMFFPLKIKGGTGSIGAPIAIV
jgi:kynurenine formamidase